MRAIEVPREKGGVVRLVLMSDTHGHHRKVKVPDGDVLIHAGDFTYFNGSTLAIRDFNDWLFDLPHRNKVLIPGNHDSGFAYPAWRDLITAATLLINKGVAIGGLKIWGSPVTPGDWGAFGADASDERAELFSRIPGGTDILITHAPPFGILDQASASGDPQGCHQLRDEVCRIKPLIHVFGHVHEGYGMRRHGSTLFVNAALAGVDYEIEKSSISIDIRLASQRSGARIQGTDSQWVIASRKSHPCA